MVKIRVKMHCKNKYIFVNAQLVRADVWHLRWMHLGSAYVAQRFIFFISFSLILTYVIPLLKTVIVDVCSFDLWMLRLLWGFGCVRNICVLFWHSYVWLSRKEEAIANAKHIITELEKLGEPAKSALSEAQKDLAELEGSQGSANGEAVGQLSESMKLQGGDWSHTSWDEVDDKVCTSSWIAWNHLYIADKVCCSTQKSTKTKQEFFQFMEVERERADWVWVLQQ